MLAVASLGIQSEVGRYFKTLGEPHSAYPLAMWCGEKETSPYPIGHHVKTCRLFVLTFHPKLISENLCKFLGFWLHFFFEQLLKGRASHLYYFKDLVTHFKDLVS